MRPISLEEILRIVQGSWLGNVAQPPSAVRREAAIGNVAQPPSAVRREAATVSRVTIDSRKAAPGDLFVAIRGAQFDGHDFLPQAAAAGCTAAIVESGRAIDPAVAGTFAAVISVPSTLEALANLARLHRQRLRGHVIGVTGSVGKTTVKGMIHHILSAHKTGSAAPKSFNNNIGVPLTLLAAGEADDYVVCELGSNAPGEIAALTRIAQPDIAVITAVGASHLEKLGSVQGVAAEKVSILSLLEGRHGVGILWADSEVLRQAAGGCKTSLIRFGAAPDADVRLTGWESDGLSQRFQVNDGPWFTLPLAGRHNATNALAAIAAAMQLGLSLEQAGEALATIAAVDMRLQARTAGDVTVINDAYNANPMSMAAAIDVLGRLQGRRRVFVAGDMRELGENSPRLHLELGRRLGGTGIDVLVTVGALGGLIAQGAQETGGASLKIHRYPSAADAAAHVDEWLRGGDTVLVKASRGVAAECIVETIISRGLPTPHSAPAGAPVTAPVGGRP